MLEFDTDTFIIVQMLLGAFCFALGVMLGNWVNRK